MGPRELNFWIHRMAGWTLLASALGYGVAMLVLRSSPPPYWSADGGGSPGLARWIAWHRIGRGAVVAFGVALIVWLWTWRDRKRVERDDAADVFD